MALPWSLQGIPWDFGVDSLNTTLIWISNTHHIAFTSLKGTDHDSYNLIQVQGFLKASTNGSWYPTSASYSYKHSEEQAELCSVCLF